MGTKVLLSAPDPSIKITEDGKALRHGAPFLTCCCCSMHNVLSFLLSLLKMLESHPIPSFLLFIFDNNQRELLKTGVSGLFFAFFSNPQL